jgi:hypothetical protein
MIDGTTRILLEKYDPTNEALRAPVGVDKSEALPAGEEVPDEAVAASQKAVEQLALEERARKLVESAKQAKLNKGQ